MNVDLVLEGGGVKGIALVGAYSVLEERGYTVKRVAGSSAGAIVGALIASGMKSSEMFDIMQTLDYTQFQDETLLGHLKLPGEILSILFEKGICKGDFLEQWLDSLLKGATFADFSDQDDDPTSATYDPHSRYRLLVMASDISNHRLARLPWDFSTEYPTTDTPDGGADARKVSEAVRCSMSIPFFYQPHRLKFERAVDGKRKKDEVWMVDGGMLSNFPVDVFDRKGGAPPRWPTFGIKLSSAPETAMPPETINNTFQLTKALVATMTGFFDRIHIEDPGTIARTIFVDTGNIRATKFNIGKDEQDMLFANGKAAALKFLDGTGDQPAWDFDKYIAKYRTP